MKGVVDYSAGFGIEKKRKDLHVASRGFYQHIRFFRRRGTGSILLRICN